MGLDARSLLILALIALLLFGARKLPDLARSLGRSMRILKAETKGMDDESTSEGAGTNSADGANRANTADRADRGAAPQAGPAPHGGPAGYPPQGEPDYPELQARYVVEEADETGWRQQGR